MKKISTTLFILITCGFIAACSSSTPENRQIRMMQFNRTHQGFIKDRADLRAINVTLAKSLAR